MWGPPCKAKRSEVAHSLGPRVLYCEENAMNRFLIPTKRRTFAYGVGRLMHCPLCTPKKKRERPILCFKLDSLAFRVAYPFFPIDFLTSDPTYI
ncbi:hypothetical protein M413DRAFT_399185 [Hebeloma cylindrosporum]|uniref:Uncharacterized protein n=1 Tax=Hebeloma cylindrosporum TaxID=76867 RepID=A0A0C3C2V8_HEBCY|nr:hypothetical protein M413DRAFT_399185 [Hebeloma cylindrosporum h7]